MSFDRRTLLKSLAAGSVAPFLTPLVGRVEAAARGELPIRVVFFLEGNGLPPTHVQPLGIERRTLKNSRGRDCNDAAALIDLPLDAESVSLPEPLTPLERHRKRLTIVQGLSGRVCGGGHSNGFGALGAYSASAGPRDITIDAALARANPAIHQHVALGILNDPSPTAPSTFTCCSASGPNQKVPHYQDPSLAYEMLFGKILGKNLGANVGAQSILLDHLAADMRRLERALPHEESHKVQQFADALRSIGQRQSRLGEIDPAGIPAKRAELYGSFVETERLTAHAEIVATALIAGLTNTVTLSSGATSYPTWKGLGITVDNHQIGHEQVEGSKEMRVKIRQFNLGLLAGLADRLEAVPEGSGTMMDNTLFVYLSDSAEDHHSTCFEWPMVLLGNLGGRLRAGDRFLNFARYGEKGHATVAQLYATLLHATGAPVDHFGTKDRELQQAGLDQGGPLDILLA
jgi:hypothetical protein